MHLNIFSITYLIMFAFLIHSSCFFCAIIGIQHHILILSQQAATLRVAVPGHFRNIKYFDFLWGLKCHCTHSLSNTQTCVPIQAGISFSRCNASSTPFGPEPTKPSLPRTSNHEIILPLKALFHYVQKLVLTFSSSCQEHVVADKLACYVGN